MEVMVDRASTGEIGGNQFWASEQSHSYHGQSGRLSQTRLGPHYRPC